MKNKSRNAEYMRNQVVEPEYLKPCVTPSFWRGVTLSLIFSIPFWGILIALVWTVDKLIGGS